MCMQVLKVEPDLKQDCLISKMTLGCSTSNSLLYTRFNLTEDVTAF